VAIVKDISKNEIILNQLNKLSLVAEKTDNLVMIMDASGRIEYVNPAFESKTGYYLNEILGKNPDDFISKKESNQYHQKINKENYDKVKSFQQEVLNYSKSGKQFWVSRTINPIFNENGVLTNFISIEKDITERKKKEDLLSESEERLQFVLKGSELGYWDWIAESGKMTVNDRWYEMLGYDRNDFKVTIENWHSLVHPDDMLKLNNIMQQSFPDANKSDFSVEIRAKHKKGHYIWILDRGAVVKRNRDGSPNRISGMHMDISERKKLENELEEERNFLNQIISANALSLIIINKKGEISFANEGAEHILGLSKSTIESKKYNDPDWKHITIDEKLFPVEELPFSVVMETKENVKDFQHGIIWQDGTKKYISVTGGPLSYNGDEIEEIIFSVTDITKRIEAQKQLGKTKTQMQTILKDMADVVWSVSIPDYKMIYITPSIEKLTGYPQSYYLENFVGDRWEERVYHHDKYLVKKAYEDIEKTGHFEVEYRIRTKDDQLKWVLNKGTIIYSEGKSPIRLDGYISDISARKEQENEVKKYIKIVEEQNERLKNFTYIVSHNLRSHSANIQGLMYLINKKHPEIAEVEYVKMLEKASNKLDDTLHHLNNVVSVVSTADEMHEINLYEMLNKFVESIQHLIEDSNIQLKNKVAKNIWVEAVPAFLESIITNLITNAIKYRDEQKPYSYVEISSRKFNGIVIISFTDNGLGIDLEKYGEKLFGMYKTFHTHKDSRGLGLFLTKNQVESMGGKIEVESKAGEGTTFKVFLKDGKI
jgi:PAS domain S-box-containing protein